MQPRMSIYNRPLLHFAKLVIGSRCHEELCGVPGSLMRIYHRFHKRFTGPQQLQHKKVFSLPKLLRLVKAFVLNSVYGGCLCRPEDLTVK